MLQKRRATTFIAEFILKKIEHKRNGGGHLPPKPNKFKIKLPTSLPSTTTNSAAVTPSSPQPPTPSALLALLKRCSTVPHLKQFHAHLVTAVPAPPHPLLLHALSRTYNSLRCLRLATLLLIRSPPPPSPLLYNVLIRSHSKPPNDPLLSLHLLSCLLASSRTSPDNYTFTFAIAACARIPQFPEVGESVQGLSVRFGFLLDLFVGNSLISMYSAFSWVDRARKVFDLMPERDVVTWTSLMDGYAKAGELTVVRDLFEEMPERNDYSWAVVIAGNVRAGMYEDGLEYFRRILVEGTDAKPNEAILVSVLSACAHMGALEQGKWVHAFISRSRFPQSSNISTALINMYSKCGRIECAKQVFDNAPKRDVLTWTSMISGLAMYGLGSDALRIFYHMADIGIKLDGVTFLGVLNACSHSGLLDEGISIFYKMSSLWGVVPQIEHYGCLIDLLGRAGQVEKAFETALNMPISPDIALWRSLLSACRVHRNVGLAECVVDRIAQLNPRGQTEGQMLLSNLYAATKQWEGVERVRRNINQESSQVAPGCSWIEADGMVNKFLSADRLHPQITEIRSKLVEVLRRVSAEGLYIANTANVLFDLSEEEKEHAVSLHSEKLALAYGLMLTEAQCSIRIMKNLRICEDCHSFMKAVSRVYYREIIVRDRTRFHTFADGSCSCGDYW